MLRKRDWLVGALGILLLIAGAVMFLGDGVGVFPLWFAWLVAPVLWYAGFLFACVYFLMRALGYNVKADDPLKGKTPLHH